MQDDLNERGVLGPSGSRNRTSARRFEPAPATDAENAASQRSPGGARGTERRTAPRYRMPAEWEPHEATWIAWPHHEPDWPGKLEPIPWVYAEIVRVLHQFERVEILCHDEEVREAARRHLDLHGVRENYRLHVVPNDRVWLRDSAPSIVRRDDGAMALAH